ncbi:MATE family efflux transporter [Vibrio chagasii]|uniref:MATE family efflux transporter n=1 Tax=Vibrio chagasii TaxID=170679 RepID=UPI0038CDA41F
MSSSENKMITGDVTKEYIRFVVPSILGLLAISSAGVVDAIFVGKYVGATALAAVSIMMPVIYLFFGICVMIVIGSVTMSGKAIGENDTSKASDLFSKSIIIVSFYAMICSLLTFFFAENLAYVMGAKEEVIELSAGYIQTIAPFMLFMGLNYILANFTRIDGAPNLASAGLIIMSMSNILLDYLFIKVFGLGIGGAALASGLGHLIGTVFLASRFMISKSKIKLIKPRGSWKDLINACCNGFSEFVNEISGGLVIFVFNWILMLEFGANGVAAFTIVNYILWLSVMVGYGNAEALSSLVSVNYGARQKERVNSLVKVSISFSTVFGALLMLTLFRFSGEAVGFFLDENEQVITSLSLVIVMATLPALFFNGINIALTGYFTGVQAAKQSSMIALSRSLILPIMLALVLWQMFGVNSAFYAIPIAEILTFLLATALYFKKRPMRFICN